MVAEKRERDAEKRERGEEVDEKGWGRRSERN